MNFAMWQKALTVIPNVTKSEWDGLDLVSRWLISTRAAVLVMTAMSAILAGLFAWGDDSFNFLPFTALIFGLILAHAGNNLLNDHVDFARGVDQMNYFRTMYGPHPLEDNLMNRREHIAYFLFTVTLAFGCGLYLAWHNDFNGLMWLLIGSGAFFLFFYTWPLKYFALGEVAVFLVWGPLMVGGGFYVITSRWEWSILMPSAIYALGVTTVIFGKHIDKIEIDRAKHIFTLPVLLGEMTSRLIVIGMMILSYLLIFHQIATGGASLLMLGTLFAIPRLRQVIRAFLQPKPAERPEGFPEGQGGWPLYFATMAFWYNRTFGSLFILGLIADITLKKLLV